MWTKKEMFTKTNIIFFFLLDLLIKTNNSDILFLLPATQAGNCLEHREYVWVWVTKANETYKHEETSQKVNAYIGQLGPNLAQLNLLKRNSGDQIVVVWGGFVFYFLLHVHGRQTSFNFVTLKTYVPKNICIFIYSK